MLFHETTEINEVVERLKLEKAGECMIYVSSVCFVSTDVFWRKGWVRRGKTIVEEDI